jgi:hypothetical protein
MEFYLLTEAVRLFLKEYWALVRAAISKEYYLTTETDISSDQI